MLGDILSAISLGRKLVTTIADLRRDIHSVSSENAPVEPKPGRLEALDARLSDIECQAREHHARVIAVEQSLNDTLRATEALAERVSTIFWVAGIACGLAGIALIIGIVALTRTLR
jgi:hypothetical protein